MLSKIRSRSRRYILDLGDSSCRLFSSDLANFLAHDLVTRADNSVKRRLEAFALYDYLETIAAFEQRVINPSAERVARGFLDLPFKLRQAASWIYAEEANHSATEGDLRVQLTAATGVSFENRCPRAIEEFCQALHYLDPKVGLIVELAFAVVVEITISKALFYLPRDPLIHPVIRAFVMDHASDEAGHQLCFRALIKLVWSNLTAGERLLVGQAIPELTAALLEPDYRRIEAMLRGVGFSTSQAERIRRECLPANVVSRQMVSAARPVTNLFGKELGAFADLSVSNAFVAAGLLAS